LNPPSLSIPFGNSKPTETLKETAEKRKRKRKQEREDKEMRRRRRRGERGGVIDK